MTADKTIAALAALAHEHRLAAYRLLVETGPNGLSAGLVAERLGIPPSSLTFHLQQLFRAELITQRRLSRQLIYAANFGTMNTLVAYLTENCCGQVRAGALSALRLCVNSVRRPQKLAPHRRGSPHETLSRSRNLWRRAIGAQGGLRQIRQILDHRPTGDRVGNVPHAGQHPRLWRRGGSVDTDRVLHPTRPS